jgi:hypothetical protein
MFDLYEVFCLGMNIEYRNNEKLYKQENKQYKIVKYKNYVY